MRSVRMDMLFGMCEMPFGERPFRFVKPRIFGPVHSPSDHHRRRSARFASPWPRLFSFSLHRSSIMSRLSLNLVHMAALVCVHYGGEYIAPLHGRCMTVAQQRPGSGRCCSRCQRRGGGSGGDGRRCRRVVPKRRKGELSGL